MSQRFGASVATPAASRLPESSQNQNAFTLPPSITNQSHISLVRLPIPTNSKIRWQKFTNRLSEQGESDKNRASYNDDPSSMQHVQHQLMQIAQEQSQRNASSRENLKNALLEGIYWTCEKTTSMGPSVDKGRTSTLSDSSYASRSQSVTSIWILEIEREGAIKKSAESSHSKNDLFSRINNIKETLTQSDADETSGIFSLQNLYQNGSLDDPQSEIALLPNDQDYQPLSRFVKALEDFLLLRWVWSRQSERHFTQKGQSTSLKSDSTTEIKEKTIVDEEEEGALGDEGVEEGKTDSLDSNKKDNPVLWTANQHAQDRPVIRSGKGVMVYTRPYAKERNTSFLESQSDATPLRLSLRCFVNDTGHVFLETWPCDDSVSQIVQQHDANPGDDLLLAPLMIKARFIKFVGSVSQHNENSTIKSSCEALYELLQLNAVDTSFLVDQWISCSYRDQIFLWPAQLCLLYRSQTPSPYAKIPSLVESTLHDVTTKARRYVRETLGLSVTPEPDLNASSQEDDDQMEEDEDEDQDDQNTEFSKSESPTKNGHTLDTADTKVAADKATQNIVKSSAANTDVKPNETVDFLSLPPYPSASRRNSAVVIDSNSKDEDMDLWGSIGFVGQGESQLQTAPRSRDGFDDPGFGLVTEDDFSFFDDGAADFSAFTNDALDLEEMNTQPTQENVDVTQMPMDEDTEIMPQSNHEADQGIQHIEQDNGESTGTGSSAIDPPSLPGFTPGSFSESSPAVGGMNVKTPRTPFSPNQELADTAITIEGEHGTLDGGMYGHSQYNNLNIMPNNHSSEDLEGMYNHEASSMGPPDARFNANQKRRQNWTKKGQRDITSKYEQGKFAMPFVPVRKKQGDEENSEQQQQRPQRQLLKSDQEGVMLAPSRSRLGNRTLTSGRRLSFSKLGMHSHTGLIGALKGRLGAVRGDEEMSEATVDGTISDNSSLMEEDSADEESISSKQSFEEDQTLTEERKGMIQSSVQFLQAAIHFNLDSLDLSEDPHDGTIELESSPNVEPAEWNDLVRHLIDNPQLRLQIGRTLGQAKSMTTISRYDSQHLFTLLQGYENDCTVETCLGPDRSRLNARQSSLLQVMEPSNVLVGCQGSVTNVAPSALSYWDKLGLMAVGGQKDVAAFALHTDDISTAMEAEIRNWLDSMANVFRENGLGSHVMSTHGLLDIGAISRSKTLADTLNLMAKDAERWSDTVDSLVSRVVGALKKHSFVVIYAIGSFQAPDQIQSFVRLQRDLRSSASLRYGIPIESIVLRPCSWESIRTGSLILGNPSTSSLRKMAMSIYDSLQVTIDVQYNREQYLPQFSTVPTAVQYPSFSILPASFGDNLGSAFRLDWHFKSTDIFDRGTLLHVAYHLAPSAGQPSMLAIVDERGQGYTATAWRRTGSLHDEIQRIWNITIEFTMRSRNMWKIVLCKDRAIGMVEVHEWSKVLKSRNAMENANAFEVTLACTELNRALSLILPLQSLNYTEGRRSTAIETNSHSKNGGKYIDASVWKYVVSPQRRIAMRDNVTEKDKGTASSSNRLPILPLRSSLTVTMPQNWNSTTACSPSENAKNDEKSIAWPKNAPHHLWIHILQVYKVDSSEENMQTAQNVESTASSTSVSHVGAQGESTQSTGHKEGQKINFSDPLLEIESKLERITKSFQDLELIARERAMLPMDDPTTCHLPWHLAILQNLSNLSSAVFVDNS